MIFREDCGYVQLSALKDPFVQAAYRLCGEWPPMPSMYTHRVDPKTVAREELADFLDSLGTKIHNDFASDTETLTCSVRVLKSLLEDNNPSVDAIIASQMRDAALQAIDKRRQNFAPMLPDKRGEHDRSRTEGPDGGRTEGPPTGDST